MKILSVRAEEMAKDITRMAEAAVQDEKAVMHVAVKHDDDGNCEYCVTDKSQFGDFGKDGMTVFESYDNTESQEDLNKATRSRYARVFTLLENLLTGLEGLEG